MKGPYTHWREQLESKYRTKAETIVRWFDATNGLDMSDEEKVRYLQQEFAGIEMYFTSQIGELERKNAGLVEVLMATSTREGE